MDLKDAFLEFHAVMKNAPKRCPTDQLKFWALLGAKYLILADAIADTNDMCEKAADRITELEKENAELLQRVKKLKDNNRTERI